MKKLLYRPWHVDLLRISLIIIALAIFYSRDKSQQPAKVAIPGVHHSHNPGAEMFNINQDNVKSEKRQAEVLALVQKLLDFRPAKVIIEKVFGDTLQQVLYEEYLSHKDDTRLSENEKEQVGFRVAAAMKHENIYIRSTTDRVWI